MDRNLISNPCTRCGKPRIVISTSEERVGNSNIVTKETVCPDPECQAKVEKQLKSEEAKRIELKLAGERRNMPWEIKKKAVPQKTV